MRRECKSTGVRSSNDCRAAWPQLQSLQLRERLGSGHTQVTQKGHPDQVGGSLDAVGIAIHSLAENLGIKGFPSFFNFENHVT